MTALRMLLLANAGGGAVSVARPATISVGTIATVTDNTKYNAWPVACRTTAGILLGYTRADSHHADNTGNAVCKLSTDEGATWGSEVTIYDHASLWASVYGLTQLASGRIIAVLWRDNYSVSATGEPGVVYSDDGGATWSSWIALSSSLTQDAYGAGPVIELTPGGDLLLTIEGTASGSILNRSCHTLRSTDGGATWGSEVTVRNYATDTRPYYESKLVRISATDLRCVHRCSAGTGTHYVSASPDGGLTWGVPWSAFSGYAAPSTLRHHTGTLVVATRRNSDGACIAYASIDDGTTWGTAVVVDATMTEMEYACPVERYDGTILLVYGSQPSSSITNSDIKSAILTLEGA